VRSTTRRAAPEGCSVQTPATCPCVAANNPRLSLEALGTNLPDCHSAVLSTTLGSRKRLRVVDKDEQVFTQLSERSTRDLEGLAQPGQVRRSPVTPMVLFAPNAETLISEAEAEQVVYNSTEQRTLHATSWRKGEGAAAQAWVTDGLEESFTEDMLADQEDLTHEERVQRLIRGGPLEETAALPPLTASFSLSEDAIILKARDRTIASEQSRAAKVNQAQQQLDQYKSSLDLDTLHAMTHAVEVSKDEAFNKQVGDEGSDTGVVGGARESDARWEIYLPQTDGGFLAT